MGEVWRGDTMPLPPRVTPTLATPLLLMMAILWWRRKECQHWRNCRRQHWLHLWMKLQSFVTSSKLTEPRRSSYLIISRFDMSSALAHWVRSSQPSQAIDLSHITEIEMSNQIFLLVARTASIYGVALTRPICTCSLENVIIIVSASSWFYQKQRVNQCSSEFFSKLRNYVNLQAAFDFQT